MIQTNLQKVKVIRESENPLKLRCKTQRRSPPGVTFSNLRLKSDFYVLVRGIRRTI